MQPDEGFTFEFNSREPVYLQVVRHFKVWIATDRLKAGQTIPSRRELAVLAKINPNTAQRAYREMEEKRLIVTEGNSPSRITGDERVLRSVRSELLEEAVDRFLELIRPIDVSTDELVALVRQKHAARNGGNSGHD
jgi:DNA-binding transcriptional regulator YhcF (GntR family)